VRRHVDQRLAVDQDLAAAGVSKPASIDRVVLLPEPLEPRKVRNSPSLMSSEMLSTAKSP
jgi:hypothetical protein